MNKSSWAYIIMVAIVLLIINLVGINMIEKNRLARISSIEKQLSNIYEQAEAIDELVFDIEEISGDMSQVMDMVYELEKESENMPSSLQAMIDDIDFVLVMADGKPSKTADELYRIMNSIVFAADSITSELDTLN